MRLHKTFVSFWCPLLSSCQNPEWWSPAWWSHLRGSSWWGACSCWPWWNFMVNLGEPWRPLRSDSFIFIVDSCWWPLLDNGGQVGSMGPQTAIRGASCGGWGQSNHQAACLLDIVYIYIFLFNTTCEADCFRRGPYYLKAIPNHSVAPLPQNLASKSRGGDCRACERLGRGFTCLDCWQLSPHLHPSATSHQWKDQAIDLARKD